MGRRTAREGIDFHWASWMLVVVAGTGERAIFARLLTIDMCVGGRKPDAFRPV